jgi:chaperonin cofactor prefoldin
MSEIKYYNNNPCKVLREVGEGFSEIVVFPHVQDLDMNGGDWCIACQVGGIDGAYPSHTCDPYQEVIDVINDQREDEGVVVIADNRLLHNEMVEWKAWKTIKDRCEKVTESYNDVRRKNCDMLITSCKLESKIKTLEEDITLLEQTKEVLLGKVNTAYDEYDSLKGKINQAMKDPLVVLDNNFKVELDIHTLRSLIEDSIKLEQLESGGVDNWEWYSESIDFDNLDDTVDKELSSYKVSIL